jgi:dihydroorotate dehydrogenase (fumarate)
MSWPAKIRLGRKQVSRIMSASGAWAVTKKDMDILVKKWKFQTIVSKTCTLEPKVGNPEPNFINLRRERLSLNCMGMPNHGFEYYKNLLPYFQNQGVNYILSLDGTNIDDLIHMLVKYNSFVKSPQVVEINLSCPNTSNTIPSYSIQHLEKLLFKNIRLFDLSNLDIGLKLSPLLDPNLLIETAAIINKFSVRKSIISHVVCSNSIPNGLLLDEEQSPVLSARFGGISGYPAKLIALNNVYRLHKMLEPNIQIIGCGGIETMKDVQDYLSCGASGVQIGRAIHTNSLKLDFLEVE